MECKIKKEEVYCTVIKRKGSEESGSIAQARKSSNHISNSKEGHKKSTVVC